MTGDYTHTGQKSEDRSPNTLSQCAAAVQATRAASTAAEDHAAAAASFWPPATRTLSPHELGLWDDTQSCAFPTLPLIPRKPLSVAINLLL